MKTFLFHRCDFAILLIYLLCLEPNVTVKVYREHVIYSLGVSSGSKIRLLNLNF